MFSGLLPSILFPLLCLFSVIHEISTVDQLPFCNSENVPELLFVSTMDGKFSAIDHEGSLQWQIDTEPGSLLTSNIQNLELSNNGHWIRILPSLSGLLYRFDGSTIEPIPISTQSLLRSSFKYSDDLIIAGGIELQMYGIGFRSGRIFYRCSSTSCANYTGNSENTEDILILERNMQTVRAVEILSGNERWNLSVGHLDIKLPQISCAHKSQLEWTIRGVIPEGLLLATILANGVESSWKYKFSSPIVKVWKWNGNSIVEIELFPIQKQFTELEAALPIYVGMHNKQLYIHESNALKSKIQDIAIGNEGSTSLQIPWKPISASQNTGERSTAISVLYNPNELKGKGYFLFSKPPKQDRLCQKNKTKTPYLLSHDSGTFYVEFIITYWKELFVTVITTGLLFSLIFKSFVHREREQNVIFVERHVELPVSTRSNASTDKDSNADSDSTFHSRYANDFDTLRCLGKGGFGVVFAVKQKIDECHYAIKRITLPNEESKRDTVMREVKALAKLDHNNIVRYFNSWVEKPPPGRLPEPVSSACDFEDVDETTSSRARSNVHDTTSKFQQSLAFDNCDANQSDDSFIEFKHSSKLGSTEPKVFTDNNWEQSKDFLLDTKNSPTFLYIQMQLCQKESLREWLMQQQDRSFNNILGIFKQILSAVEYVHMNGLIHRDLKPSNIFFSLDGRIKVGDFGLVKDIEESWDVPHRNHTQHGHTKDVGTRLYMSPEQLCGKKYNYKVDIYSLGLIFFELLVFFDTDMERITTLSNLRKNIYPPNFIDKHGNEHNLLSKMLCHSPERRLTTFGIKARPPVNEGENIDHTEYDYELPRTTKVTNGKH